MAAHSNDKPMKSVHCRMISPEVRQGPFIVPTARLTIGALVTAADLPEPSTAPVPVWLELVRSHDEAVVDHEVVLDATYSPIGTWRWWIRCPHCHHRRQSLYVFRSWLACASCSSLRYGIQTLSSPRRRADLFCRQRAVLEARPGRRSKRWGRLVIAERQEALWVIDQAVRSART